MIINQEAKTVAIIPVAGIGSRLRPHTHTQPKALVPVAGKPIIGHIVDHLKKAGVTDFIYIIGYLGDKVERYITTHYSDLNNRFVIQTSGKGTGHAIHLCKNLANDYPSVLIVLGDTIVESNLQVVIASESSMLGVKKVDDPRMFGVAEVGEDNNIQKLIEKPPIPKSNLALVGVYFIKEVEQLFETLQYIIDHDMKNQDEYHLTDALMLMIQNGVIFKTFNVDNWFDCGKKDILLQTNALLLNRLEKQTTLPDSDNTVIIHPVHIGKDVKITHSVIGPYVSVGDNTILDSCIIKNSIIGPYAHIENAVLKETVVGNDAHLKGLVYTLNLGDSTEINFS
jgi:glucose-1-phosphate thymidylyltransferase